ncbi:MAG TPA: alpha/beta hydrolase fold domain-containing protein, partial [Polyangiales bacterium]
MEDWKRWISVRAYGLVTSLLFGAHTPPARMRARFARMAQGRATLQRKHPGLTFQDHRCGALDIEAVRAQAEPQRSLVHLHGGAFVFGCPASYRNRAMRLSHRCQAEVFVPAYRLAPEHPFPAALDDAVRAIEHVRALHPRRPLFLSGDSAGGALALSALLRLRERGRSPVQGALLLSPWTDLSVSGGSVDTKAGQDRWFTRAHLEQWAGYYR